MFNGFQEFGIVKLLRALAAVEQAPVREWAQARGYERYLGSSVKGEATIDWSDKRARAALLSLIVADADRLLELSRQAQGDLPEDSEERLGFVAAAELLGQLLLQDVERADDGVGLKDGVSRDRFQHGQPPQGYLNPPRCGGPAATRQLAQWRRAIRGSKALDAIC